MKKSKLSLVIAALLASVMTLVSCGGAATTAAGETTKAAETTAAAAETTPAAEGEAPAAGTVVYWSMWESTEPQGQVIKEAIDAFTAETGIPVTVEFKGRTGIREGLQPALDAGTVIDIFDEDIDRVNNTFKPYLLDLEELAKGNGYEATANAALLDACRVAAGGSLMSIPYQPNVFAMFYNKEIFDAAGVTAVPKTWAEFLDACEKIKTAGYVPLTVDDAYATALVGYHLARYGGEAGVVDLVNSGKWSENDIATKTAADFADLVAKGYVSANAGAAWPSNQNGEFALGEVAMYLNGSWLPNEVREITGDDYKWGCFSYPAVDGGKDGVEASNFGAQVFGINAKSTVSKEAFDLITYLTKGEWDLKLSQGTLGIPADSTNTEWPAQLAEVKPVLESLSTRYTWAGGAESNNNVTPALKDNFIQLLTGSMTADDFVAAMDAAGN